MRNKLRMLAVAVATTVVLSACAGVNPESGTSSQGGDLLGQGVETDRLEATDVVSVTEGGSLSSTLDAPEQPLVFSDDGVTTMTRGLSGGSYGGGVPVSAIAGSADAGLRVTVVDIRPAILNTVSGEWDPSPDMPAARLHNEFASLMPYTVVVMRVDDVLGVRPEAVRLVAGDEVEVWFLGGSKPVTVTKEQALAIGLEGELDPAAEDKAVAEGTTTESPEVTGDLELSVEMAFSVYFEEGDSLILFGRSAPRPTSLVTPPADSVLWSLVPQGAGVFIVDASGQLTNATTSRRGADVAELVDIARSLAEATGPSLPVRLGEG